MGEKSFGDPVRNSLLSLKVLKDGSNPILGHAVAWHSFLPLFWQPVIWLNMHFYLSLSWMSEADLLKQRWPIMLSPRPLAGGVLSTKNLLLTGTSE